jgi:hypothetical protein
VFGVLNAMFLQRAVEEMKMTIGTCNTISKPLIPREIANAKGTSRYLVRARPKKGSPISPLLNVPASAPITNAGPRATPNGDLIVPGMSRSFRLEKDNVVKAQAGLLPCKWLRTIAADDRVLTTFWRKNDWRTKARVQMIFGKSYKVRRPVLLAVCAMTLGAEAHPTVECAAGQQSFDGRSPLTYQSIAPGLSKATIHQTFPPNCDQNSAARSCDKESYVAKGNTLGVGKVCGAWAFVQYIGVARVTTGWVNTGSLSPPSEPARPSVETPFPFILTRGKGVPVCEAYLQRMNQTDFVNPPYCGRPESGRVPGFRILHRRWMDSAMFNRVYISVSSLLERRPVEDYFVHSKDSEGRDIFEPPKNGTVPSKFQPLTWTYDPEIDIDNDGVPDNVAIWGDEDRTAFACVEYVGRNPVASRSAQWGIVLNKDSSAIDVQKTKAIFGYPGTKTVLNTYGSEVGVFVYRDITYFDTFFTNQESGDFNHARKGQKTLRNTLGVFERRDGRTAQVCEYRVEKQGD